MQGEATCRPSVAVGSTRRAVTAHAGAVLLRDVMDVLGPVSTTDNRLGLKRPARGLSEATLSSRRV